MKKITIIFDLSGTLVKMRPPKLLIKKESIRRIYMKAELGVITGAKRSETSNILSKLKIKKYFKFVITKNDSVYQKPDKRLFSYVKKKFLLGKVIYIGDTKKDFLFAKNAGVKFCYIGKRKYGIYQSENVNQTIQFIVKTFLR